ncbi:MAG: glucose 1-dehydrogenase [Ottowia sp.]|uniref:SDR family NAD(P)-dependent oxidoreductase n=1 Tax=Ottowia sp. TaxID=1898956 RepID=UPI003C707385
MTAGHESRFRLDGRVAVVTGGAGGICAAICHAYAHVGARVACLDFDREGAEKVAKAIRAEGGQALGIECDVSDESSVRQAIGQVHASWGLVDVLVSGAAILDQTGTILDIDPAEWHRVMNVNLHGSYYIVRSVLPDMIRRGKGSVILVASMHGSVGRPGRVSYTTGKAALIMMARTMALDHAEQGVRFNTLSPGAVATRRIAFRYGEHAEEKLREAAQKYPLKRFAAPEEMVGAALFLASDASSYMTGSDLLIDGGYVAG